MPWFWSIGRWVRGKRINEDILHNERAEYGKQVVEHLATHLVKQYGRSFHARNLRRMMQFASTFPHWEILTPLVTQLSWAWDLPLLQDKKE